MRIARDSKGRLSTNEKTVSFKIRLEESTTVQLKALSEQLGLPIASIIRQGIHMVLHYLSEESK